MTHPIDCTAAMRQLWDYLDEELTTEREADVRAHLATCAKCYPHFEFEQTFLSALASTKHEGAAPARLRSRVVEALRAAGFTPG